MRAQEQGLARVIRCRFFDAKDLAAFGMQDSLCDKVADAAGGKERQVELEKRLRPAHPEDSTPN
jgi:hypothetical protein